MRNCLDLKGETAFASSYSFLLVPLHDGSRLNPFPSVASAKGFFKSTRA